MAIQRQNWLLLIVFIFPLQANDPAIIIEAYVGEDVCLPCTVKRENKASLSSVTVNWQRSESDEVVHSFYSGQNHPEYQSERFKERTQFCSQDIFHGNVSLRLKNVTLADFGNYSCHAAFYENGLQTSQRVLLKQKNTPGANVPEEPEKLLVTLIIVFIIVIPAGILACWYWRKKKSEQSQEGEEGATQEMEEFSMSGTLANATVTHQRCTG